MKKYILPFLVIVLIGLYLNKCTQSISAKEELREIERKRDSLNSRLYIVLEQQKGLMEDTAVLYQQLRMIRASNENKKDQLRKMTLRQRVYESKLKDVLDWSDAVMDSLFARRYPSPDRSK